MPNRLGLCISIGVFAGAVLVMGLKSPLTTALLLDRCPTPHSLQISNVTDTSAVLDWTQSDSTIQLDLGWRLAGSPDWTVIADVHAPYSIEDLAPCQDYEVRLRAVCDNSESAYSQVLNFEADGCCRIPTYIHVVGNTSTSVQIAWDNVEFAFAHHVRYRAEGDDEWIPAEVATNQITVSNLQPCTAYELQVGSKCDLDSTEFSTSLWFQTSACGACTANNYCVSAGDDASMEWIDSVSFGALRLRTGSNNGYLLANTVQTGLERKRPYVFHVSPAATIPNAEFYLRMWIDLDGNGEFVDSTELLVDPVGTVTAAGYSQTITIPDSIPIGSTRMRIALKSVIGQDTIRPSACGNFLFGEVEDYCISIDDLCPEVILRVDSLDMNYARLAWQGIDESIVFVYQYKKVSESEFSEPELTQDSVIELTDLAECTDYVVLVLNVCIQDTSSVVEFEFRSHCINAVRDLPSIAEDVVVYPNPFDDHLTLSLRPLITEKVSLSLYSIQGVRLRRTEANLNTDIIQQLSFDNLNLLSHGMYLLVLETRDRQQVFKVVR